jgi:hypothetical protein
MSREITIWDEKPLRAARIHEKLSLAMQKLKIRAGISIQSEPPLIARQNLGGQTPAIEIEGKYWRIGQGKEPDQAAITSLMQKISVRQQLDTLHPEERLP